MDQADTSVRSAFGKRQIQGRSSHDCHTPVPVLNKCPYCTRKFSNMKSLMQHSVVHMFSLSNRSGVCELHFEAEADLTAQPTSHQNLQPSCLTQITNFSQIPSQGQVTTDAGNQQQQACNVAGPQYAQLPQNQAGPQGAQLPQNQAGPQGAQLPQNQAVPQGAQLPQNQAGPQGAQLLQNQAGPQGVQIPTPASGLILFKYRTRLPGNNGVENVVMEGNPTEAAPALHHHEGSHQNVPNATGSQERGRVRPVVTHVKRKNRGIASTVLEGTLRRLKTVHTGHKHESCLVCGFANAGVINRHNPFALKPYGCGICGLQFRLLSALENHQNVHSNQTPYQCDQCQKSFRLPRNLRMHKNTHSIANNFQCEECGHTSGSAGTLHQHRQSHAEHMRYTCDICGMDFKKLRKYENHCRVSHPNDKPHRCDSCGKHFSNSCSLGQHREVMHGLTTPCQCSSCRPRVARTGDKKQYQCNLCQKRCKLPEYLMIHKLHAHNVLEAGMRQHHTAPSVST